MHDLASSVFATPPNDTVNRPPVAWNAEIVDLKSPEPPIAYSVYPAQVGLQGLFLSVTTNEPVNAVIPDAAENADRSALGQTPMST